MRSYRYKAIVHQIQEMIHKGALVAGDKLPPERTLARTFKVSRNSVRQAVQDLSAKNLVESRQGDGTYVCANDSVRIVDSLARAIGAQKKRLREILELRQCLEPQIARIAASEISPAQLDCLKIIVCDQEQKFLANEPDHSLDQAFHQQIALASGNTVIQEVFATLSSLLNESRSEFLQNTTRTRDSITGHLKIITALEKKDPVLAQKAMEDHIHCVEQHILN